ADAQTATMQSLELFSRRWSTWELGRVSGLGVIEAALLCERLADHGRIDLACHTALCLVKGAWAAGVGDVAASQAADAAGRLFDGYAAKLWDGCGDELLDQDFVATSGPSAWITYPIRCTRIAIRLKATPIKEPCLFAPSFINSAARNLYHPSRRVANPSSPCMAGTTRAWFSNLVPFPPLLLPG
ncbi:MAG: hypothetical protein U1D67_02460, partial [Dehalococcoidia bacterium]|nr:hypothetical protein [Dehalococcoidia bacterium]